MDAEKIMNAVAGAALTMGIGGFGILVKMYVQLSVLDEKLKYQGRQISALLEKTGLSAASGKSEE